MQKRIKINLESVSTQVKSNITWWDLRDDGLKNFIFIFNICPVECKIWLLSKELWNLKYSHTIICIQIRNFDRLIQQNPLKNKDDLGEKYHKS